MLISGPKDQKSKLTWAPRGVKKSAAPADAPGNSDEQGAALGGTRQQGLFTARPDSPPAR